MASTSAIEIFCCYAHEDRSFMQKLRKYLRQLEREGLITIWSDIDIDAGSEWEREIEKHLNTAHIILLLISPDFTNSDYCTGKEMKRAMERHEQNEACVIPVMLRTTPFWQRAPFGKLQAVPFNAEPISKWPNEDDAFSNVAEYIESVITKMQDRRINRIFKEIEQFLNANRYSDALRLCNDLIGLEPDYALIHMKKGQILFLLKEFEEAKKSFEEAISIDPKNEIGYLQKGNCLIELKQHDEAISVFENRISTWNNENAHIIRKDIDPYFYHGKSKALLFLQKYEQALEAINQAIMLMSPDTDRQLYRDQGLIYRCLSDKAYELAGQAPNGEKHEVFPFPASIENNAFIENGTGPQKHRLAKGQRTHDKEYTRPILQALIDLGGSAKSSEVLPRVELYMRPILKPVDYDPLPSDPQSPRWRNAAQWVRYTLVQEGLLRPDSPRGVWEITEVGRQFLLKYNIR